MNKSSRTVSEQSVLITAEQASQRYALNRGAVVELAKSGGAFLKIGKCARIDVQKMDAFIRSKYTV